MLLSPDHTATLTDPQTWKDNPFIMRDERRDIKKRQPFLSFCWMAGVLILVAAWGSSLLWSVDTAFRGVPLFIGGDLGTSLCVILSGVHIWFIIGAARKHTTRQFTEESNQNTLSSLLMLPISPFQILVQTMVYPWAAAMRMAVALLPVYVFCVGIDGPTWLELAMLYLVFAMAALAVPHWNRPALSENIAILAPPKQNRFAMNTSQNAVGQEGSATKSVGASGALAFRLFLIPIVLSWMMAWRFGGITSVANGWLTQYLPNSIVSLLVAIPVSWPLVVARTLITPLDWFGIRIIPLLFVLPLFFISRYSQLVRASEYLSVGAYRDLPLQSTYRPRLLLAAGLRIAMALVIGGYFWKLGVVNGALAYFAPQIAGIGDPGLGGFAVLLFLFAGVWGFARGITMGQWQNRPLIRGERFILCRNSLPDGARYLCEPFGFALAFYLACCLFARTAPFPQMINGVAGSVGAMVLQLMLIGISGSVLSFGVARLFGAVGTIPRFVLPGLIAIGVFYSESVDIRNWLASFPQAGRVLAFIPPFRKLEVFSPFLGMLHVATARAGWVQRMLPGAPPWYSWVLTGLVVGGAMWLIAHLLDQRKTQPEQDAVTLVYNPTILSREVFSDPGQLKKSAIGKTDTRFVTGLIARLQTVWDNAVVARELRSRLRGQWEPPVLWTVLGLAVLITAVCFHPQIAPIPTVLGGWTAFVLMGAMRDSLSNTAAGVLGCWYLLLFFIALCNSFVTTGAFFAETQRSTLGFMLATPMSTRSIVLGKAAGLLGPSLGILAALSVWTLVLTLLFMPLVGPHALLGWFYAVFSALTLYLMINGITFTISAMFPKLSMSGSAWVWVLLFWFGSGPLGAVWVMVSIALGGFGLQGTSLWAAFIGVGWLLILLAYTLSVSSLHSMRRRDLSFASSKRGN